MALGIKSDSLSFEILPAVNPKVLLFLDTSTYKEEPSRPLLEITLPGHGKYNLVNIVHRKINVLNSNLVGLSALLDTSELVDLPDGVWTFKYKICPYDLIYVQRYHLRTTQLECKLRQIYQYTDFSDCCIPDEEKVKKEILDILLLIESGKAEAELGFHKKAGDRYHKASKKVNKLLDHLKGVC